MDLIEYPDAEMMMMDLADTLAGEISTCLTSHDWASLAVPGGTTPGPIFDTLSGARLQWDRVHVMLTDERWVPETSERSNTRLLRARLLRDRAAAARLVPLYAPAPTPEEAIETLIEGVRPELPISILLLGMGADMHTASLFPGADRLVQALSDDAPPLMAMRAEGAPEPRITLTAPALRSALSTHVVIIGPEKRAALERAQRLTAEEAPIMTVLRDATVHWAEG
ncbi:6-phosphogluconolactonase [Profundibacterium mesophilum]|uniref:6-phosphogluconolactonase n=1 Tax=Profundibacterium mesophilum KAUST100406-0324 TaxID=1037889 RepID=A0A921TBB1_9RHOB|nr:6-phosphogluconolactonase [Profundibacterium mesophilum]KAF0675255.1 6-phosphogluconolactonase [Profundibacterium mesophilum KAUST100406-0324]